MTDAATRSRRPTLYIGFIGVVIGMLAAGVVVPALFGGADVDTGDETSLSAGPLPENTGGGGDTTATPAAAGGDAPGGVGGQGVAGGADAAGIGASTGAA